MSNLITYECYGDRVDCAGRVLRKGDTIELDNATGAWLMDSNIPIRPVVKAEAPAAPAEEKSNVTV